MRKYLTAILLIMLIFNGCEKDEICIEAVTPLLIITFYDVDNPTTLKSVNNLKIQNEVLGVIYENQSLDSIVIPLDIGNDAVMYDFQQENATDQINFNYLRDDVFVSRSCGFKTIFNELSAQAGSSNWIKNINIINDSVEDEIKAHINIYH